ncbi:MAG TPA: transposase [Agitococcus sp.]|nr:transposase [Agitococcus sp.]
MSYNDLRKGRYSQIEGEYFITIVLAQRTPLFTDFNLARCFVKELAHSQKTQQGEWLAWVVMPDHFHGLLRLHQGTLSTFIKNLKGRSAKLINEYRGIKGQSVWQSNFYDHALRQAEDRLQIARYIVANPLRAGLVSNVAHYPHWDSMYL